MKKLIVLMVIFALVSCSKEDNCTYDEAELRERYEYYFEQELSPEQELLLREEFNEKLKEAC